MHEKLATGVINKSLFSGRTAGGVGEHAMSDQKLRLCFGGRGAFCLSSGGNGCSLVSPALCR